MKLSYKWLNQYADINEIEFGKTIEKISLAICEIDHIVEYRDDLNKIVAVKILEIKNHPNSEKLRIARVSDSKNEIEIVTNDFTVTQGDIVPLALPGAKIQGRLIENTSVRGIQSPGMFCSEADLQLGIQNSGVLKLQKGVKIGSTLRKIYDLEDIILTIDNKSITHRPDLWSHFGFAREIAGHFKLKIKYDPLNIKIKFSGKTNTKVIKNKNAHSYMVSEVMNVQVGDSNNRIKSFIERCGIRSINTIVDVSNFILLETGQPTHFFDREKLQSNLLCVDFSKEGEELMTLDGKNRKLAKGVLTIRDKNKPIAIAGVMGGEETAVSNSTKSLVLESAVFKREDIRKSVKLTQIRSEASMRYEKGLNPMTCKQVIARAYELLKENGSPNCEMMIPVGFENYHPKKIKINISVPYLDKKIGNQFKVKEYRDALSKLNFVNILKGQTLSVEIPEYRKHYDITTKEDLVEEVSRIIGFENIKPASLNMEVKPIQLNEGANLIRRIRQIFSNGIRYNEVYNYSFSSAENGVENVAIIENQMPEDQSVMRSSLVPSILKSFYTNQDRFENIKIFESGRIYSMNRGKTEEQNQFVFAASYKSFRENDSETEINFLKFREDLEVVLKKIGLQDYKLNASSKKDFHPNCQIQIRCGQDEIGIIGLLHPKIANSMGIKRKVFCGLLFNEGIMNSLKNQTIRFVEPSVYPQDSLDLSILVNENESTEKVATVMKESKISEIVGIYVKDIFRGPGIPSDKKSVTYRIDLINLETSFTQEKINSIKDKLIQRVNEAGYSIR